MKSQELLRQSTSVSDLNCQTKYENKMNPWLKIPAEDYESHMSVPDAETLLIEAGSTGAVTADSSRVNASVFHCTLANK